MLKRLESAGLVVEADRPAAVFVPARPLDQMRLLDVLDLYERDETADPRDDELSVIFGELDAARDSVVGAITFADLVARTQERSIDGPASS
jgi:hypothetical protein